MRTFSSILFPVRRARPLRHPISTGLGCGAVGVLGASRLCVFQGAAHRRCPPCFRASVAFEQVLQRDAESAAGYLGLAGCALLRRDLPEAVRYAAQTVVLRPRSPFAFLILARAYQWQNQAADAIAAGLAALSLVPDWVFVHRSLAQLYDALPGGAERAATHRKRFRELKVRA